MKKRKLGKSGIEVSPLAFGGNVFGWTANKTVSFQLLDAFVEAGGNLIDTADAYSVWVPGNQGGESEIIIGNWMKQHGNRDKVLIATKVGWEINLDKKGLRKTYILKAVEDSLKRLQTDYIDLYQSHKDDPSTPVAQMLEAYSELVKAGKVRIIGASNLTAARLEESLKVSAKLGLPKYQSLQPHYNLYDRAEYEQQLEPSCKKHGLGVICYFGLARGFLTGKYRSENDLSQSARGGGMKDYLNDRGFRILAALDSEAARLEATPAQVALAWLMTRLSVTAPIASATNVAQVKEIVRAADLQLDTSMVHELTVASAY